MKGIIKKENEEGVVLDLGIGTVKFRWEAIENIERSSLDEVDIIRQEQKREDKLGWEKAANIKQDLEDARRNTQLVDIAINPMIELDFKTKSQIYDIRKEYVFQHPELASKDYSPSEEVFGEIEDGKPWWGILGACYYGDGDKSIEGLSEESRFLANPFLLVGLKEVYAHRINDEELSPKAIYPRPINLVWQADRTFAKVKYDITSYWKEASKYSYSEAEEHILYLAPYNARDFGFSYLYVTPRESKNISSLNKTGQALSIPHMLHCGGSCGYPGGCNNASPEDSNFKIKIKKLPAHVNIKLWRNEPEDVKQEPDMLFILDLI